MSILAGSDVPLALNVVTQDWLALMVGRSSECNVLDPNIIKTLRTVLKTDLLYVREGIEHSNRMLPEHASLVDVTLTPYRDSLSHCITPFQTVVWVDC